MVVMKGQADRRNGIMLVKGYKLPVIKRIVSVSNADLYT